MKQISTGRYLGMLKLIGQNIMPYLSIFTLIFSGIAAYTPISSWFLGKGLEFPFWAFLLVVVSGILSLTIFEYFIMFPSYFSSWNKQMWEHDSPVKQSLEELKSQLDSIEAKLK